MTTDPPITVTAAAAFERFNRAMTQARQAMDGLHVQGQLELPFPDDDPGADAA